MILRMQGNNSSQESIRSEKRPATEWVMMQIFFSIVFSGLITALVWALVYTALGRGIWFHSHTFFMQTWAQIFHLPSDYFAISIMMGIVFVVVFAISFVHLLTSWKQEYFEFSPHFLFIARGPTIIDEHRIPYEEIELVTIQAGTVARLCGIASLVVTYPKGEARIVGLSRKQAEDIAEQLKKQIAKS